MQSQTLQREASPLPKGGFAGSYGYVLVFVEEESAREGFVCRQTGHPVPRHFWRQLQWKTCWQGMVSRPEVSSIRSRQTGHVGSSTRFGVGGGNGFMKDAEDEGMKGS